jgi:hypothetical protein
MGSARLQRYRIEILLEVLIVRGREWLDGSGGSR